MEENLKVYLAKSNKANPNVVSEVRQTLSNYEIEIVEFNGGAYSHKQLLECDFLIIVPHFMDKCPTNGVTIGKGLYEQINEFDSDIGIENIFVVIDNQLNIDIVDYYEIEDSFNYIDYGVINFAGNKSKLVDDLDRMFNKKVKPESESESESDYYHLISKKRLE